jgi:hypothetical protein
VQGDDVDLRLAGVTDEACPFLGRPHVVRTVDVVVTALVDEIAHPLDHLE